VIIKGKKNKTTNGSSLDRRRIIQMKITTFRNKRKRSGVKRKNNIYNCTSSRKFGGII